ncbi:MAG: hypothetical protein N2444_01205, partial [Methylocystis sp.]|nr:hypothetical protein [Methylocystis sp.]
EQELEETKASRARDLADVGRHAARVAELDQALKRAQADNRDMDARLREAQKIVAERTALLNSTERALQEMTERAERDVERLRLLESDRDALGRERQAQQSRVIALESKISALHEQNSHLQSAMEKLLADFARVSGQASRAPMLEADLLRVSSELETSEAKLKSLSAELDAARAQLRDAQERARNTIDHLENALRHAREESRDHADKLETARADVAVLQGAVEALRSERANLRAAAQVAERKLAASASPAVSAAEIAALRAAIVDFGDRIVAASEDEALGKIQRAL